LTTAGTGLDLTEWGDFENLGRIRSLLTVHGLSEKRRYDRLAVKGEVPLRGFSMENIYFTVLISPQGKFVELRDERTPDRRGKAAAVLMNVPQPPSDRRGLKIVPGSFWDPVGYAIGYVKIEPRWDTAKVDYERGRAAKKFNAFREGVAKR
jgi:CRISPR-associated protein Csd1